MIKPNYAEHYAKIQQCCDHQPSKIIRKILLWLPESILKPLLKATSDITNARYYAELESNYKNKNLNRSSSDEYEIDCANGDEDY